jgi:ATP-binding protein involved in chromosome partitioning
MITEEAVKAALKTVKYPGFSRDIVSFGLVRRIEITGNDLRVLISLNTRDANLPRQIHASAMAALLNVPSVGKVDLDFDIKEPDTAEGQPTSIGKSSLPGVKKIIAVASGKGGVGKSTIASNLAIALAKTGAKVGLCDCDLYGPSMGMMLGTDERPMATDNNEIIPVRAHGIQMISMALLLDESSPVVVRGPMATRYTQQFLRGTAWDDLDYLVIDFPPGTGDIQLTIAQTVAVDGAVIVTTPQEIALIDARKAISFFAKLNVPILGIVENMAYFECPSDGIKYYLFGQGGGRREAEKQKVPLLGEIPLDPPTGQAGDRGTPVALLKPEENVVSRAFQQLAKAVLGRLV